MWVKINKYYVSSEHLKGYNILYFDNGKELMDIGYNNILYENILFVKNI
jgi:DNA/RNA endonuclease YhcR with UshA esterase domain